MAHHLAPLCISLTDLGVPIAYFEHVTIREPIFLGGSNLVDTAAADPWRLAPPGQAPSIGLRPTILGHGVSAGVESAVPDQNHDRNYTLLFIPGAYNAAPQKSTLYHVPHPPFSGSRYDAGWELVQGCIHYAAIFSASFQGGRQCVLH
jgi:hypothetical protein